MGDSWGQGQGHRGQLPHLPPHPSAAHAKRYTNPRLPYRTLSDWHEARNTNRRRQYLGLLFLLIIWAARGFVPLLKLPPGPHAMRKHLSNLMPIVILKPHSGSDRRQIPLDTADI